MTTAPLVANDDTDLAAWQSGTQETFLEMVCAEVRKFCGWHIAPSVCVTDKQCWLGQRGLVSTSDQPTSPRSAKSPSKTTRSRATVTTHGKSRRAGCACIPDRSRACGGRCMSRLRAR